jgi:transcriptional regulator with AAA-type ATPase domain
MRRVGAKEKPELLVEFERMCAQVLGAFEPAIEGGKEPVRRIVALVRGMRKRGGAHPGRTLDALDALVTAARSGSGGFTDQRIARELAKMLRGRVLLHYAGGRYLTIRPQTEHTLSTWTLRCLVRDRRLVAWRVKARPEFWRPEQRRPAAVLTIPLGEGVLCIARTRRFTRRELRAVRVMLRFVDARRSGTPVPRDLLADAGFGGEAMPLAGEGLIGRSGPWRAVLAVVRRVARTNCSVVLLGETGTGKERLARAIHATSARSQHAFVAVNCGAVPSDLLASELFGHVRGAFTGADRARDGYFVRAHRGTLFLDEVADMPPPMQVALLRALEQQEVVPVGATRPRTVDVRVVAATNKDLEAEVRAGRFREDLYHRVAVVELRVPPLRERLDDLPLLAQHLLSKCQPPKALHVDALAFLARHPWPGNIRELDNILRAAALLVEGPEVTPEILDRLLRDRMSDGRRGPAQVDRPEAILRAIGQGWRSAPELAEEVGVSIRTVNRDLERLQALGRVVAEGEARARRYRCARRDTARFESRRSPPA